MKYNIVEMVNYVLKNNAWSLKDEYIDNIGEVRVFCFDINLHETTDLNTCFNIFMGYTLDNYFYSIDVYFERVIFRIYDFEFDDEDEDGDGDDKSIELIFDDVNTEEKFFQYCLLNDLRGLTFEDIKAILKVQKLIPEEVLNPLND
ncbi:hypothetical protein GNZ01_05560 [Escherichia coli]|uniref:Uncharacterized protein n=1 Tax=Escherichia coli TaxID=562 RepID=A0AAJ2Y2D3_ECOLX|nr:hypothetical protein [Escherichia coli]MUM71358.1 hypothetical protein [Escherichia coli]MUM82717.1 hypothetical protein [Escherichia coli]